MPTSRAQLFAQFLPFQREDNYSPRREGSIPAEEGTDIQRSRRQNDTRGIGTKCNKNVKRSVFAFRYLVYETTFVYFVKNGKTEECFDEFSILVYV